MASKLQYDKCSKTLRALAANYMHHQFIELENSFVLDDVVLDLGECLDLPKLRSDWEEREIPSVDEFVEALHDSDFQSWNLERTFEKALIEAFKDKWRKERNQNIEVHLGTDEVNWKRFT